MDYIQQSDQGCLAVNLMCLFGIQPTVAEEAEILFDGLFQFRESYTIGCLQAFLDRYPVLAVTLYVDNKYYLDELKPQVHHPRITMIHQKNDERLLRSLNSAFIVYVDNNITDSWTHLPHLVLVTSVLPKYSHLFDSWEGKDTEDKTSFRYRTTT
jgi:hypothetical protein